MIAITGKTKLVGLLGQPVNHSLSPVMHNAAYEEMGLDWCYVAIPCDGENIEKVTTALRIVDCKGLNITIPHKQEVIKACNNLTETANKIQAVNTLVPEKNNQWIGANTDVEGFLMPLKNHNLMNFYFDQLLLFFLYLNYLTPLLLLLRCLRTLLQLHFY